LWCAGDRPAGYKQFSTSASTNSPRLKWSSNKLGFDEEDHPISTRAVGMIPIVCTPTINNIAINRTLID
jgi:hypothetical protein